MHVASKTEKQKSIEFYWSISQGIYILSKNLYIMNLSISIINNLSGRMSFPLYKSFSTTVVIANPTLYEVFDIHIERTVYVISIIIQ